MVLLEDFLLPIINLSTTARVSPAINSYSLCDTPLASNLSSFTVPIILLAPALVWPVALASTRAQNLPLFGYPFNDRAVVLQVRARYVFSQISAIDCLIGEMSPYCAGDYFELPVFNVRGEQCLTQITFVCALVDSKTKTWLVIQFISVSTRLISCSHFGVCSVQTPLLCTWLCLYYKLGKLLKL